MTNGEYVTRIVEQDEDFCILTDDVAGTVTIEVSLAWWNKPLAESDGISRAYIEPIVEELENICINGDEYILSLLSRIKNAPLVTSKAESEE